MQPFRPFRVLLKVNKRRVRRPLVHPTPFQKWGSWEQQHKNRHLTKANAPPPIDWDPKPNGVAVMPKKWLDSGLGWHLSNLTPAELEQWAVKALRPEVDKATLKLADFTMTDENFRKLQFKRRPFKREILNGAERAFGILIPTHHRLLMASVDNIIEWFVQRVELARPSPTYVIPKEVDEFLEVYNNTLHHKRAMASNLKKLHRSENYYPLLDDYNWDQFAKKDQLGWMDLYVKNKAATLLAEQQQAAKEAKEREEREAKKEASLKALADRKAKALAMKAAMEEKKREKAKKAAPITLD